MSAKNKLDLGSEELLQENARLRGDLLTIGGRVSHDLLTPLGSILISLQLLKETLPNENPTVALALESLATSAEEIKQLVESVSLLAKADGGSSPNKRVAMGEIVSAVLAQFEKQISKSGATVASPKLWPGVDGVPKWLEFVWRSFLADALQRGGRKIQLGWKREKTEFHFWMSDDGQDGSADAEARMFQSFDSLHGLDSAAGVGLSIARRLVESQGGHCGCEVNAGTPHFFFTLPAEIE